MTDGYKCSIDILGIKYNLFFVKYHDDEHFCQMQLSGYTDEYAKQIVICDIKSVPEWAGEPAAKIEQCQRRTLRHEIIHAFLSESGLSGGSSGNAHWADNEEMIDWFAIQAPKIYKVYNELGILY